MVLVCPFNYTLSLGIIKDPHMLSNFPCRAEGFKTNASEGRVVLLSVLIYCGRPIVGNEGSIWSISSLELSLIWREAHMK